MKSFFLSSFVTVTVVLLFNLACRHVTQPAAALTAPSTVSAQAPAENQPTLTAPVRVPTYQGRAVVAGHRICVVDLQDGGNWDWSRGEPPKDSPAYYLRF